MLMPVKKVKIISASTVGFIADVSASTFFAANTGLDDNARLDSLKSYILPGLASGAFKPWIAKTFPFERIVDAHRYLESNDQFGKIVVTV
jgi:NADPH:quinone reductase-like Zn-dependent oxidoreductase